MSINHYIVFVGATPSLSTELLLLRPEFQKTAIIAPAISKRERARPELAVKRALGALVNTMRNEDHTEVARLSVWTYAPSSQSEMEAIWKIFGNSAWVEFIPRSFISKDRLTRQFIADEVRTILSKLHDISVDVYVKRNKSPLPLPFRNFRSSTIEDLSKHWYNQRNVEELRRDLRQLRERFRQQHTKIGQQHWDDRDLCFSAAALEACHGQPHPIGPDDVCYVNGRFRFGAALFPGFHYDVRSRGGNLLVTLYDCAGTERPMTSEKRAYINIFPNDHMLPVAQEQNRVR